MSRRVEFGIAFAFVLLAAVFIVSISVVAVGAILLAIGLVIFAGMLRAQHPSDIDIFLDAMAWTDLGITLGVVVARAVFAPGRITFHRVVGAVLLYLCFGLVFVSLYCFVALREPNAFSGLPALHDNRAVAGNLIYLVRAPPRSVTATSFRCIRLRGSRQRRSDRRSALSGDASCPACYS